MAARTATLAGELAALRAKVDQTNAHLAVIESTGRRRSRRRPDDEVGVIQPAMFWLWWNSNVHHGGQMSAGEC
ncbi:hypothetical protein JOD66_005119 [Nocardioides nitrophenolicus]|nr:hypothetical protein [Nocardioides nitrophenolicus]